MRLTFSKEPLPDPSVLVLGMFDGVHSGHAWLMRTAREWGALERLPVVVSTFCQHPLTLIKPAAVPLLLSTVPERAARIAQLKADVLSMLPFDLKTMHLSPKQFVEQLVQLYNPRHVVVGFNYTFGSGGEGDASFLKKLGRIFGFEVHVVSPVQVEGHTVSSSLVRKLLEDGQVELAARMLERPYAVTGRVEHGKNVGSTLGFPTANVVVPMKKALPAYGIYVAWAKTNLGAYPAVVSLGKHPTLPEGGVTLEAYLLNYTGNLYGQKLRVKFLMRLRDEIKFGSVQELKDQIGRDVYAAKKYFGMV
jgi:riboflavin kinase / FMN adenylyltransferase